jgi:hypothetical protein
VMNGRVMETKTVELPEQGRGQVEFANVDVQYGSNRGEIRVDGDDSLKEDNRLFFSIERAEPGKALYIYDGRQSPAYFRAALEAGAESAFSLESVTTEQAANLGLSKYSYIVLAATQASGALDTSLKQYVNAGGGLLVALNPATAATGKVPVVGSAIQEGRYSTREGDRFQTATNVDMTHPALQRSNSLDGVKFYYAAKVDPGKDRVLARLSDGTPLLVERGMGEGRILVLASSFDNVTSDLPLNPVFVPFVEHVSKYLEGGETRRANATVGAAVELRSSKDRSAAAEVVGPDGQRALSLQESASALNFTVDREGFYEVRTASGRQQLIAVNADRRESDLTPIPEDTLALWSGEAGSTNAAASATGQGDERTPYSLWRYLLIALLAVSLAESWLANRFTSAARDERVQLTNRQAA